jgi:hypothetical protein
MRASIDVSFTPPLTSNHAIAALPGGVAFC